MRRGIIAASVICVAVAALAGCEQAPGDPAAPRSDAQLDKEAQAVWNKIKPDSRLFGGISIGESLEADVITGAGEPEVTWREDDGTRTLEYPRGPEGATTWMVKINAEGRVAAIDQVLTAGNFARLQPGMTSETVRKLLGKPGKVERFPLKNETVWTWRWQESKAGTAMFSAHFDTDGKLVSTSRSDDPRQTPGQ